MEWKNVQKGFSTKGHRRFYLVKYVPHASQSQTLEFPCCLSVITTFPCSKWPRSEKPGKKTWSPTTLMHAPQNSWCHVTCDTLYHLKVQTPFLIYNHVIMTLKSTFTVSCEPNVLWDLLYSIQYNTCVSYVELHLKFQERVPQELENSN